MSQVGPGQMETALIFYDNMHLNLSFVKLFFVFINLSSSLLFVHMLMFKCTLFIIVIFLLFLTRMIIFIFFVWYFPPHHCFNMQQISLNKTSGNDDYFRMRTMTEIPVYNEDLRNGHRTKYNPTIHTHFQCEKTHVNTIMLIVLLFIHSPPPTIPAIIWLPSIQRSGI